MNETNMASKDLEHEQYKNEEKVHIIIKFKLMSRVLCSLALAAMVGVRVSAVARERVMAKAMASEIVARERAMVSKSVAREGVMVREMAVMAKLSELV